jgi:hypothetical protein
MAVPDVEIQGIVTTYERETAYHNSDEVAGSCDSGRVYPLFTQFHRNQSFSDTR